MASNYQNEMIAQINKHIHEGQEDAMASRELELFIENDGRLYSQMTLPILKNLARKKRLGKFDRKLAILAFRNLADEGARRYESGGLRSGGISRSFPPNVRTHTAISLYNSYIDELDNF